MVPQGESPCPSFLSPKVHWEFKKWLYIQSRHCSSLVLVFWVFRSAALLVRWLIHGLICLPCFHLCRARAVRSLDTFWNPDVKTEGSQRSPWRLNSWRLKASSFQTVLYLRVLLFNLVTPEGFFDDREPFAIAMFLSRADLRDASSLLLFILATWTKGPMASVLESSELVRQKPWHFLSAELKHSHRSADRRRRDGGLPRP